MVSEICQRNNCHHHKSDHVNYGVCKNDLENKQKCDCDKFSYAHLKILPYGNNAYYFEFSNETNVSFAIERKDYDKMLVKMEGKTTWNFVDNVMREDRKSGIDRVRIENMDDIIVFTFDCNNQNGNQGCASLSEIRNALNQKSKQ